MEISLRNCAHCWQVARLPNAFLIAAGSSNARSVELLTESGWAVREEALKTPREDSANVMVDVKHFPECL